MSATYKGRLLGEVERMKEVGGYVNPPTRSYVLNRPEKQPDGARP